MLVLSRQRDERIIIGDESTVVTQLSPLDIQALKRCVDPGLLDLADRLLATVGTKITLTTVDIRGDKVRIGVGAPKDIPVHRSEIAKRIQSEQRIAGAKAGA